jgi:hypothetical protein
MEGIDDGGVIACSATQAAEAELKVRLATPSYNNAKQQIFTFSENVNW